MDIRVIQNSLANQDKALERIERGIQNASDNLETHRNDDRKSFKEVWIELNQMKERFAYYKGAIALGAAIALAVTGLVELMVRSMIKP